jgi:hypothetical protein
VQQPLTSIFCSQSLSLGAARLALDFAFVLLSSAFFACGWHQCEPRFWILRFDVFWLHSTPA